MARYGGICHVCGQGFSDDVDHVDNLAATGNDSEANLRPIHREPCHRLKTQREAALGRSRGVG